MFTSDQGVIDRISSIATIVSAFQIVYGLQSSLQGCLRGMGYQLSLAGYSFLFFFNLKETFHSIFHINELSFYLIN